MKKLSVQKWIIRAARKDGLRILLLAVISGTISFCAVWFALISRGVVDIAIGETGGNLWRQSAGLVGVLLFQAVLNILQSRLNVKITGKMEIRINQNLFARLYEKKWPWVSRYHSGDILNRMTNDVSVVVNAVVSIIPRWVSMITRLAACIVVMLIVDVTFTLILTAVGLSVFAFSRIYGKKMKKIHRACQESEGKKRSFMQECVENWIMVQSFGARKHVGEGLEELQQQNFKNKMRRNLISNVANTAVYVLFSGSYYIALAWGSWRLASGAITFGTLTAFLQIVHQIQIPFRNMSGLAPQYFNMLASAERLIELEDLPEEESPISSERANEIYSSMKGIAVRNLSFSYDNEPVLSNAELYIKKGEFVAVTGHSGIGKSTLLRLLLGFLEPTGGQLLFDTEQGEIPAGTGTRPLFSYVPQGNMLLSGTIRQNMIFGCSEVSDDVVWQAAKATEIADFIRELPDGMDTMLGERGLGLSEGQIQRLAIARGILRGAPIILLDEATSALDERTEAQVLKNLRALPDKTCICVSHRPAALAVCDRAVEVRDGKIVQLAAKV